MTLSVVVAVQHAEANLPAILSALQPAAHHDVEFIFCHTQADPRTPELVGSGANLFVLRAATDDPIPCLWRDGIRAATGERVATTTAHCIPTADWVGRLLAADLTDTVGVGGTIRNAPGSDAKDWAVFLLRYAAFAPPRSAGDVAEIAADNALYRRADLLRHADLLDEGFWEPSFHARFRSDNLRLRLDPDLTIVHRNCYTARQIMKQRSVHGREYGLARARALPWAKRVALAAASAAVPAILLRRIVATALAKPELRPALCPALPWLTAFVLSWSWGEARGYAHSLHAEGFRS